MDVLIQKVGERDGKERFQLVRAASGETVTKKDNSEATIRRYFRGKGLSNNYLDECFQKARERFQESRSQKAAPASNSSSAKPQEEDDDLLFELGLEE